MLLDCLTRLLNHKSSFAFNYPNEYFAVNNGEKLKYYVKHEHSSVPDFGAKESDIFAT